MWAAIFTTLLSAFAFADASAEIRVAFHNVQNYFAKDSEAKDRPRKSEKSIAALMQVYAEARPDILVICEMGLPDDFHHFRKQLSRAGLEYPHAEYLEAADASRHVCLLSRFPIAQKQSVANLTFNLNGVHEHFQRGILDVTIAPDGLPPLRILATHLKSKRPAPQGQAMLRRHEALLLRKHIEAVFENDPQVHLLLMADLNDTKNEPVILEVQGVRGDERHLTALHLRDAEGDAWTHYWAASDTYSRIDYAMVNRNLLKYVNLKKSGIYRSGNWNTASDHRLIYLTLESQ